MKVYYGTGFQKCGTFFTEVIDFYDFVRRVKDVTKTFQGISCDQIRVRYLDDENCYVNLEESLMGELVRCARDVPGTNWKRINVQAEVWYSPAPTKRRKSKLEIASSSLKDERQHDTSYIGEQSEHYTSPVENQRKFIWSKEEQTRKHETEISTKTHEIALLEQSFSQRPIDSSRPACTKCHLRAGHTRTNCVSECCTSARLCGDLKRHPEEKRQIKNLNTDLQLLKIKLKRCKEELDSLRENMHSSKRTFSQCILSQLINSDREKYISYLNGREVMNWMAINTDAKKIEKICHGVVPGPSDDLQELIQRRDSQDRAKLSSSSSRSNVVKELWAKKGVTFPGTGPISSPLRHSIPVPETPEEELYQINLAAHESERNTLPCVQSDQLPVSHASLTPREPDFRLPQYYAAVTVPRQVSSSTHTSTSDKSEGNALSLLASAANLLSENPPE